MFAGEINQRPFWANFSFGLGCDAAKLTVLIKMEAREPLSNTIILTLSHPSCVRVQKVNAPNAHESCQRFSLTAGHTTWQWAAH